jgi:hypothetical protein
MGNPTGAKRIFGLVDFALNKQIHLGGLDLRVPVPGQVGPGNVTLTPPPVR